MNKVIIKYFLPVVLFFILPCAAYSQSITKQEADYILKNLSFFSACDSVGKTIDGLLEYYSRPEQTQNAHDSILEVIRKTGIVKKDNNILATYYFMKGERRKIRNVDTLCMYFDSALVKAKLAGNKPMIYGAIGSKSRALAMAARYKEALAPALESIRLCEQYGKGYVKTLIIRYVHLCPIYAGLRDTVSELFAASKAYALADSFGSPDGRLYGARQLAAVYKKMKDQPKYLQWQKLFLKLSDSLETNPIRKQIIYNKGMLEHYKENKNIDSVKYYSLKWLDNNLALKDTSGARTAALELANAYEQLHQYDSAIYYANKSILYNRLRLNNQVFMESHKKLAGLYASKGDYRKAYKQMILYNAISDSSLSIEKNKAAEEMSVKYETEKREQQLKLLQQENKIQQASAERQQLIRNSIIIIGIIVFAFTGLLFNRFKLKKKIERQQALLNERKRISSELHDDLGAQLSTARMFLNNIRINADVSGNNALIENSLSLIDSSINDLRKIMDDLQTSTLHDKGYIAATEELVNKPLPVHQMVFAVKLQLIHVLHNPESVITGRILRGQAVTL